MRASVGASDASAVPSGGERSPPGDERPSTAVVALYSALAVDGFAECSHALGFCRRERAAI